MKIALYYPWIYLTSGAERSILEVIGRSRHEWTIFTNRYDPENTYPGFKGHRIVELKGVPVDRSFSSAMKAGLRIATQKLDLAGFDALLVVCEGMGDMVVFRNHEKPVYCLCLTPLRPVFDEHYRRVYLEGRGMGARAKLFILGKVFAVLDRLAWRHYRRILCISGECMRRVTRGRLAGADRLGLAYPGIDYSRFNPGWSSDRYFLLPGRIMWTKNIQLGIAGFKRFRQRSRAGRDFRLIIAGIVDKKSTEYFEEMKGLAGQDGSIEFVIRPDDETLFGLYDRAFAVLFTAFNEDWGMVPLEAMAHGKPVIAVNRGGPLETVEHGRNGYLTEPDPESVSEFMARLAEDPGAATSMGRYGRGYVERFDWRHFVEAVDNMVEGKQELGHPTA